VKRDVPLTIAVPVLNDDIYFAIKIAVEERTSWLGFFVWQKK